ncbi:MAG: hypothetical protein JOZ36_01610, partial [Acidobacteria bacterium]|nr:hypothetical protein [Acidobacteriota bacterium]
MIDTKFDLVAADLSTADTSIIVDLALEGAVPRPIRRAKIVCTIGPASNTEGAMRDLMRLGMDVARLNFSHGTHAQHARHIARLRRVARREERTICVLGDLQGPKIRTGRLKGHAPIRLTTGSRIRLTPREVAGTEEVISTSFPGLTGEVEPGSKILLSDGLIELRVSRIQGDDVECEVITGGLLGEQQGMNLPGALVSLPSLTDKDRADLQFGIKHGVDLVALSFVRSAADVHALKDLIRDLGGDAQVVAKLE